MARLLRSANLGTTVTRQDLYDLIHNATLTGLGSGIQGAGVVLLAASSFPTQITAGTWWWDQTHQVLRIPVESVGGSPASMWLAVGPDSWECPVFNRTGGTLPRGAVVGWSRAAGCGPYDIDYLPPASAAMLVATFANSMQALRTDPAMRAGLGALQYTLLNGQFGQVVWRGFGYASVEDTYNAAAGQVAYMVGMCTAYTGTLGNTTGAGGNAAALACGFQTLHPATTFPAPILLPVFLWFPFNSHSSELKLY